MDSATQLNIQFNNEKVAIKLMNIDNEAAIVEMANMLKTTNRRNLIHAHLVGCDFKPSRSTNNIEGDFTPAELEINSNTMRTQASNPSHVSHA